jgi:hypothetical protein
MYQLLDPPPLRASDPWTGVTWQVYGGSEDLKPTNRVGEFTLSAVVDPITRATAYYRVEFIAGSMPKGWQGLLLYPRGTVAFPPPAALLPPWSQDSDGLWTKATAAVLEELYDSRSRLEGDLHPGAHARALTLIRVEAASIRGAPLLVLLSLGGTAYGTHCA